MCCRSGRGYTCILGHTCCTYNEHTRARLYLYVCVSCTQAHARARTSNAAILILSHSPTYTHAPRAPTDSADARMCAPHAVPTPCARACAARASIFDCNYFACKHTVCQRGRGTMTRNSGVAGMGIRRTLIMLCGAPHAHTIKQSGRARPPSAPHLPARRVRAQMRCTLTRL